MIRGRVRFCIALCFAWAALLAWCPRASAQQRFTRNDYAIDLLTGPVLGGARILGMGGAYTAIASGIDGAIYNPAGYAERYEKEIEWFAWDVTGGLWLSGVFRRNDFDNNGKTAKSSDGTAQLMLGGRVQLSYWGTGALWNYRLYQLRDSAGNGFNVSLNTVRFGAGYSFLNGGLVGGFTVSSYDMTVADRSGSERFGTERGDSLVSFRGWGAEFGALIRPARERYRLGFVARTPVTASFKPGERPVEIDATGTKSVRGLVLPAKVHVPWEITMGFAYQFGERRANVPWRNTRRLREELYEQIKNGTYQVPDTFGERAYQKLPEDPNKAIDVALANYRESERRLRRHQPRRYVLLSADMIIYGRTANGHGIDAFLDQTPERSGRKASYGARFGVESEIWPDRVKVRAGTYLEPSRFEGRLYRVHGTTGFDVRLFDLWRWSVRGSATMDLARDYFNWGIAFGLWW